MSGSSDLQPGSAAVNRSEFGRQAPTFAQSEVLGAPGQIMPIIESAGIGPNDRVLDVGCGTGFLLLEAARRARQAVGVDVSPAMLAEAKRKAEQDGLTNVALREAQAEALPFADERFDVVITRLTIHHMVDPHRVLREMYRVLRPEGRFAICDIVTAADADKADLHNRLERLRDPSHVQHYSAPALRQMVVEAGFAVHSSHEWQTRRRFGEWTQLAGVRREVLPALQTLLSTVIDGDAAGIQAGPTPDGELAFTHHWLVVAGVK